MLASLFSKLLVQLCTESPITNPKNEIHAKRWWECMQGVKMSPITPFVINSRNQSLRSHLWWEWSVLGGWSCQTKGMER